VWDNLGLSREYARSGHSERHGLQARAEGIVLATPWWMPGGQDVVSSAQPGRDQTADWVIDLGRRPARDGRRAVVRRHAARCVAAARVVSHGQVPPQSSLLRVQGPTPSWVAAEVEFRAPTLTPPSPSRGGGRTFLSLPTGSAAFACASLQESQSVLKACRPFPAKFLPPRPSRGGPRVWSTLHCTTRRSTIE